MRSSTRWLSPLSNFIPDSTGATDAPPEITAFTVDSSATPAERQTSGMVAFDVDATDDVGIDRIEIPSDQDFFGWHGRGWIAELSL